MIARKTGAAPHPAPVPCRPMPATHGAPEAGRQLKRSDQVFFLGPSRSSTGPFTNPPVRWLDQGVASMSDGAGLAKPELDVCFCGPRARLVFVLGLSPAGCRASRCPLVIIAPF